MTQDGKTQPDGPEVKQRTPKGEALRWFEYGHLRHGELREISAQVYQLAEAMYDALGSGREKTAGLRKLLEAKDCFVRQAVADRPELD